jgi:ubiquinone/menaquinone biosynthesis C-methylase UbiE
MLITDIQSVEKFKIKPSDRVLDVGGSMKQHEKLQIDTLVDIIRPEEAPYGKTKLKAKHFVRLDLNKDKFPFKDKEFDFCLCTHTLEDLAYPFLAIEEMGRVAKRGLIITPSMGEDMVFSHIDFTDWLTGARRVPGKAHHKWLFYSKKGILQILPKNYPLLYSGDFHFTKWLGEEEFIYYWGGEIKYREIKDLDFHLLIKEYKGYIKSHKSKFKKGSVLVYLDNPLVYLKELLKLSLRRGKGFSRLKK